MPEERIEISKFLIGVKVFQKPDGNLDYQHYILNDGTIKEIMIMQLQSIVKELEQEYFDAFKDKSPS